MRDAPGLVPFLHRQHLIRSARVLHNFRGGFSKRVAQATTLIEVDASQVEVA